MSVFGSQKGLNMAHTLDSKPDLAGTSSHYYARSDFVQGAGNGFDPYADGYTYTVSTRSAVGGAGGLAMSSAGGGMRLEFLHKSSLLRLFCARTCYPSLQKHPETHQICIPGGFCLFLSASLLRSCAPEKYLQQVHEIQDFAVHGLIGLTRLQVIVPVRGR